MSSSPKNYGAVKTTTDEEDATGDSFDPDQARYIRDTSRLTFRQFALIATPILGAILIVGGTALLLLKNFSHLYPGRGGDGTSYDRSSGSNRPPLTPPSSSKSDTPPGPPHRGSYDHGSSTPPGGGQRPPLTPPTTKSQEEDSTKTNKKGGDGGESCPSHPACAELGLIGDCCPTSSGVFLSCCN